MVGLLTGSCRGLICLSICVCRHAHLLSRMAEAYIVNYHVCFADTSKHTSPDCYVLRTPAILTVLAIRAIALLARTDERL